MLHNKWKNIEIIATFIYRSTCLNMMLSLKYALNITAIFNEGSYLVPKLQCDLPERDQFNMGYVQWH